MANDSEPRAGFWDVFTNADAAATVGRLMREEAQRGHDMGVVAERVAAELAHMALRRGTTDNVTVMLVPLAEHAARCNATAAEAARTAFFHAPIAPAHDEL
jgi:hypothetical protein